MSLFGAIPISGSGIEASQTWLNVTAGNIANQNDAVPGNVEPYEPQTAIATPDANTDTDGVGEGVDTTVIATDVAPIHTFDRGSPQADAQGYVNYPNIDMANQLVNATMAQNAYQANVAVINQATKAYQSALTITT